MSSYLICQLLALFVAGVIHLVNMYLVPGGRLYTLKAGLVLVTVDWRVVWVGVVYNSAV